MATHRQYRISGRDREAAGLALRIILKLEQSRDTLSRHIEQYEAEQILTGLNPGAGSQSAAVPESSIIRKDRFNEIF